MHEYSIVQELIERLLTDINSRGINAVKEIHLRRGSTFAEGPLQQAFLIMSENTPLEGAQLVIEEFEVEHKCPSCGDTRVITADDLIGHLYVCPECGGADQVEEAHGLVLVDVKY
jgi:hydrogenase nickel incorporation protein HypA/HybF